ncbi:uncharacterized mitochondrial protein AtMg00810-like [Vicia villosa]|uniref:uncharacterized mitochondrial protein AtMg00810-like n=1 Tax=Vicia villosa TaxID=3911 RepID=UPI00273C9245|nr:uncharacterized mitochondrial protein AtMg00810-like [Vicia villosa]
MAQGFKHVAAADHTLFIKSNSTSLTALLVYVDDIILDGTSLSVFEALKQALHRAFRIKDLGKFEKQLGLEVARSSKDVGLTRCKLSSTPLDASIRVHQDNGNLFSDVTAYRKLVGRFIYLTTTRPDIAFAMQQLSQFMSAPTEAHYRDSLRVLRHLKWSPPRGILLSSSSALQILGFSDADWGGCIETRRSISGYCFFIGDSLLSWKSKKQPIVSCSSTEAEYRALAYATRELQWMCFLLHDYHQHSSRLPVLYCDNQSSIQISTNTVFHERTKHIDIDCHLV